MNHTTHIVHNFTQLYTTDLQCNMRERAKRGRYIFMSQKVIFLNELLLTLAIVVYVINTFTIV